MAAAAPAGRAGAGEGLEYPAMARMPPINPRTAAVGPIGTSTISPHWQAWRHGIFQQSFQYYSPQLTRCVETVNNCVRQQFGMHGVQLDSLGRRRRCGHSPKEFLSRPSLDFGLTKCQQINSLLQQVHPPRNYFPAHSHPPGSLFLPGGGGEMPRDRG